MCVPDGGREAAVESLEAAWSALCPSIGESVEVCGAIEEDDKVVSDPGRGGVAGVGREDALDPDEGRRVVQTLVIGATVGHTC